MKDQINKLLFMLDEYELRFIIREYDYYLEEARQEDKFKDGWIPVCINEFIGAELLEIIQDIEKITDNPDKIRDAKNTLMFMKTLGIIA
jgi:hypothetical protein